MGAWLRKNGESIYGTRGGPWKPSKNLASTRKGNVVYLHVMNARAGRVELPALPVEIKSAALLDGSQVQARQADGRLTVEIPESSVDPVDTIVKLEVSKPAMDIPAIAVPDESPDKKATK